MYPINTNELYFKPIWTQFEPHLGLDWAGMVQIWVKELLILAGLNFTKMCIVHCVPLKTNNLSAMPSAVRRHCLKINSFVPIWYGKLETSSIFCKSVIFNYSTQQLVIEKMENIKNPWKNFDGKFMSYKCMECEFVTTYGSNSFEELIKHALENHPLSHEVFGKKKNRGSSSQTAKSQSDHEESPRDVQHQ